VSEEVGQFVALARSGAYLAGDRRVSPKERTRWRFTFRRLATDAQAALAGDDVDRAAAALELLIDLACESEGLEYFRSDDPMQAAGFVVSDAVATLWRAVRDRHGFATFVVRSGGGPGLPRRRRVGGSLAGRTAVGTRCREGPWVRPETVRRDARRHRPATERGLPRSRTRRRPSRLVRAVAARAQQFAAPPKPRPVAGEHSGPDLGPAIAPATVGRDRCEGAPHPTTLTTRRRVVSRELSESAATEGDGRRERASTVGQVRTAARLEGVSSRSAQTQDPDL
jgi:hypothetical protein